ncbi:MAG: hypothetical protein K0R17_2091 [Rariglobus sp.]|nr:hypothetical protein [Rariglobus sp.]
MGELRTIRIHYRHSDPRLAAKIVKLLMGEGIALDARYDIDDSLREIESLKQRVEGKQREVDEIKEAITSYRKMNAGIPKGKRGTSDDDKALEGKLEAAQMALRMIILKMRDTSMMTGMVMSPWRISQQPSLPSENDYLIAPIITCLTWGVASAVVAGVLAVWLFIRWSRRNAGPTEKL